MRAVLVSRWGGANERFRDHTLESDSAGTRRRCGRARGAGLAVPCLSAAGDPYIRHHGRHAGDSDDLAQAFFLHLLENNLPARADPLRGGFRPYLLAALRNFLHSQAVTAAAGKRGGGAMHDAAALESIVAPEREDPEHAFNRAWALAVLRRALDGLRAQCDAADRRRLFDALQPFLLEPPDPGEYERAGKALGMTANGVAVTVKRLRTRLRERIREELLHTVADTPTLEHELMLLRDTL